jgi:hypothetical protein
MAKLSESARKRILRDPEEFERTLRQTRNFFTHPGTKKKGKVLDGAKEIFLFNQRMHAMLRLLILLHVGFSEGQVLDPVFQQLNKWR